MRRREFIAGLGSAAAWPVVARGQQSERVRHIGVVMGAGINDRDNYPAFLQALQQLGWSDGRNVRVDISPWRGRCRRPSQIRRGIGRARA
jgi:putative tryptophan/tyrosine transport system substrate-binding protein